MNRKCKNKPILHLLYSDLAQLKKNCFISQLYEVLRFNFSLKLVSVSELCSGSYAQPRRMDLVLSVLRQRSWQRVIPFLGHFVEKSGLILYDQDPWESYHDRASCLGVYKRLNDLIPVKQFLVTSCWWADYIRSVDGLPISFVRMGVLARNCDVGSPYHARPYELGFQGSIHQHRAKFYKFLQENGKEVICLPSVSYKSFLKSVQKIGIFVHDERAEVYINGVSSLNGIWIKDIEVAARGCFALRNNDLDKDAYDIDELPTIFSYSSRDEAVEVLEQIKCIPDNKKDQMVRETVNRVRERNDWMTVVNTILAQE